MQASNGESKRLLTIQLSKNGIVRNTSVNSGSGRVPVAVKRTCSSLTADTIQCYPVPGAMMQQPAVVCHRLVPANDNSVRSGDCEWSRSDESRICAISASIAHRSAAKSEKIETDDRG